MKKERLLITSFIFLLFCMVVQAQRMDITKHPGYIDLEDIKIPDSAEEITDIDLGPALLALARLGSEDEDEDISKGLAGILSIRVKSYEIGYDEVEKIRPVMDKLEKKLKEEGWERLVRTRRRDEFTNISMKIVEGKIVGFFLMSVEPGEEVTFANVVGGNIDLESIKNFGMGLNDSALDSLKKIKEY
jgi:hypothetical protein